MIKHFLREKGKRDINKHVLKDDETTLIVWLAAHCMQRFVAKRVASKYLPTSRVATVQFATAKRGFLG